MGTNLLVRPGQEQRGPVRSGTVSTLIDADVTAIAEVPGVTAAVPENSRGAQIKYYANNTNSSVVGTTPDYLTARNFTMAQGEFINEADVKGRRRVAVLGATVAQTLFNALDPLGERIQIKGLSFTVVGVFAEKGDAGWMNPDEQIVIPLPTWQQGIWRQRASRSRSRSRTKRRWPRSRTTSPVTCGCGTGLRRNRRFQHRSRPRCCRR